MASVSTSISRKRSRDDIEDGDECMPISKRINSLCIESQNPDLGVQSPDLLASTFAGVSNNVSSRPSLLSGGRPQLHMNGDVIPTADDTGAVRRPSFIDDHDFSGISNTQCVSHSFNNNPHHLYHLGNEPYPLRSDDMITRHISFCSETSSQEIVHGGNGQHCQEFSSSHNIQSIPSANQFLVQGQFSGASHSLQSQPQAHFPLAQSTDHYFHPAPVFMDNNNDPRKQCHHLYHQQSSIPHALPNDFQSQQIPSGPYQPELGTTENPHYYSANQTLYEAHKSRVRRDNI